MSSKYFKCKKCLREVPGLTEIFFNDVYKDEDLCVTCRVKEGKKILTPSEQILLDIERIRENESLA